MGGWSSTRAYKQVARAKLDLNKNPLFFVVAKGYMKVEGQPLGCWGHAPTLQRVHNGPDLIHGPLGQTKATQHHWIENLSVVIWSLGHLRIDMDLILDPCENRLHKDSMKYLNAPIRVRIRPWRPSQVGAVLESESSLRESFFPFGPLPGS